LDGLIVRVRLAKFWGGGVMEHGGSSQMQVQPLPAPPTILTLMQFGLVV
jgi:hypothetical protein